MRIIIIIFLFFSLQISAIEQMSAINIQTAMSSADIASFGRITPYQTQSIGNILINPASLGGLTFAQLSISNYQLSAQFDYRHFSVVLPYGNLTYGISYGTNVTAGFIETALVNDVVYDTGVFSAGFDVQFVVLYFDQP